MGSRGGQCGAPRTAEGDREGVSHVYCLAGRCGGLSRSLGGRMNSDRSRKVGSDLLWLPPLNIAFVSLPGLDGLFLAERSQLLGPEPRVGWGPSLGFSHFFFPLPLPLPLFLFPFFLLLFNLYYLFLFILGSMCVYMCTLRCMCGSQRTSCGSQLSSLTMQSLRVGIRFLDLPISKHEVPFLSVFTKNPHC